MRAALFFSLLMASAGGAHAGSPGGLQLVALGTGAAAPYQPAIASYFARVGRDAGASDCENAMVTVDKVRYKNARAGATQIDAQLVLEAVFSKTKRQKLAAALSKFRAADLDRGFDGALVYNVVGTDLVLYGVSADAAQRVFTARVPLAHIADTARVNAALCHILVNLPVLAEP